MLITILTYTKLRVLPMLITIHAAAGKVKMISMAYK
jgi:hypothetical protein